jgi:hypothetical protein
MLCYQIFMLYWKALSEMRERRGGSHSASSKILRLESFMLSYKIFTLYLKAQTAQTSFTFDDAEDYAIYAIRQKCIHILKILPCKHMCVWRSGKVLEQRSRGLWFEPRRIFPVLYGQCWVHVKFRHTSVNLRELKSKILQQFGKNAYKY